MSEPGDLFVQFPAEHRIGFGSDRRELKPSASREEQGLRTLEMLSRSLNMGTCLAFVGAGCSAPFGLPSWTKMAKDMATLAVKQQNLAEHSRLNLERFSKTKHSPNSMALTSILGLCQRSIGGRFHDTLKGIFSPPEKLTWQEIKGHNPYQKLLDLGFQRFISSNYDPLLELTIRSSYLEPQKLLESWRRREYSKIFEVDRYLHSFHQDCEPSNELMGMMLRRDSKGSDEPIMIYHCHGRIDKPETMVVTETDYKNWYLASSEKAATFQQTIQLLLTASPVCFFGFSMADEDLLAALRRFVGRVPLATGTRSVFALIGTTMEDQGWELSDYILDRFGVHAILYRDIDRACPMARGQCLCKAIHQIRNSWNTWRSSWLEKPKIRPVSAPREEKKYLHCAPPLPTVDLAEKRTNLVLTKIDKLVKSTEDDGDKTNMPFLLLGSGGTGKSVLARRFLECQLENFDRLFFWSSYYSDDALTGIDRAISFFEIPSAGHGDLSRRTRLERLGEILNNPKHLLIFDGVERFLRETERPGNGVAVNWQTKKLLEVLSSNECKAVVILTSRLRPEELTDVLDREKNEFRLTTIRVGDLPDSKSGEFNDLLEDLLREDKSTLCSLLGGHTYALRLALKALVSKRPDYAEALAELRQELSHTPPESRITQMIGLAIDRACGVSRAPGPRRSTARRLFERLVVSRSPVKRPVRDRVCGGPRAAPGARRSEARHLLERLAVFMSPVKRPVLDVCMRGLFFADESIESGNLNRELIESLQEAELLIQIESTEADSDEQMYTLHPTVREFVFRRFHRARVNSLPSLILPGFTSGGSAVYPGSRDAKIVVLRLFDALTDETLVKMKSGSLEDARELCRSVFGLVRSRMSATTVTRWSDYDRYLVNIIQVANLAKQTAEQTWSFADRQDFDTVAHQGSPLYAEELAWLYNELGLVLYIQGSMLESLAVWQQQLEISQVIDSFEEGGPFLIQAHLNLGAAYIEFGRITKAEEHLQRALRASHDLDDNDHIGRIDGYLALVEHLRGDFRRARDGYKAACKVVKKSKNVRAECVFRRHLGDAFIRLGETSRAKVELGSSLALAERGSYRELEGFTRVSLARCHAVQSQWKEAMEECNAAMRIAREYKIGKLEVDVLSEQSRLTLTLGDASTAGLKALEALRLATELSLELRQTRALVLLGHANVKAGITKLGVECLKFAKQRAKQQQYFVQAHEAGKLLADYTEHESRRSGRDLQE